MNQLKTEFAGDNPFRKYDKVPNKTQVSNMYISDDPRPKLRGYASSKYDSLFSQIKPGQCIVCEPENMNATRNALQKWVEVRYPGKYAVRGLSNYPLDGKARVWLLNKSEVEKK